ncbi:hypothetical protein SLS60_011454 [Paraconiothyrium brasiliense]|uniref:Uncharacterized protein n=1 Tax=Paraconiothyrium brasiliense TaxID=300254 RepID=A0ABR3QJP7_9PLEO
MGLLTLIVIATPITKPDARSIAFKPSLTLADKTPSIVARAPLHEITQNLDVNDPGPGGNQEKGGDKEKSWIDDMAVAVAKPGKLCAVM